MAKVAVRARPSTASQPRQAGPLLTHCARGPPRMMVVRRTCRRRSRKPQSCRSVLGPDQRLDPFLEPVFSGTRGQAEVARRSLAGSAHSPSSKPHDHFRATHAAVESSGPRASVDRNFRSLVHHPCVGDLGWIADGEALLG